MAPSSDFQTIFDGLHAAIPGLHGALIAGTDGRPIMHSLEGGDHDRIAAMIATALGLGKRICESIGGGAFSETSVVGANRHVYIYPTGERGVLAVVVAPGAEVDLIHRQARPAARRIESILS